jgi:hypothetical protein
MVKKICIIIIVCCIILSSCSKADKDIKPALNDNSNILKQIINSRGITPAVMSQDQSEQNMQKEKALTELEFNSGREIRTLEEIKQQYPDKTILTIWNSLIPNDYITDALNEYLVQSGAEYVVYFRRGTREEIELATLKNNEKQLMENLIQSVDIIQIKREYYYDMTKEGKLVPWNEYLASDEGRKLYEAMPKNNWKATEINGTIYGITGLSENLVGAPSYIVNKEIMLKYGITEADLNKPIYELEELLLRIADGESDRKNFSVISVSDNYGFWPGIGGEYLSGARALYLPYNPYEKVGLIIDDTEYLRILKCINDYLRMGLVGEYSIRLPEFFISIKFSSRMPHANPWYGSYYNEKGDYAGEEEVLEIVLDDYYGRFINKNKSANFISQFSKNKAFAFDFLNRVYTDSYLANLLLYGIEKKNYIIEDGKISKNIRYVYDFTNTIGNTYLLYPMFFEFTNRRERYWYIQENTPYTYHDFEFDVSRVIDELQATDKIMTKIDKLLYSNVEDFDAYIEDIRRQLYDSGVQKLLDEANLQKEKWLENKK